MSYDSVFGHRSMAMDLARNEAYLRALREVITSESVVLDLGAGLGTLGMLAAKLGARHVYLVDPAEVMSVTRQLTKANGLDDRITVLHAAMDDVELPEQVDVITSVMTGNFLLGEDLLPILFRARDKWLKPGGVMLPSHGEMEVVPVSLPEYYAKYIDTWEDPHLDLDFSVGRSAAVNRVHWGREDYEKATCLSNVQSLMNLDLQTATSTACDAACSGKATESGLLHGWLGWFRMQLGDAWLSTSPFERAVHWSSAFLPLERPVEVKAGDPLGLHVHRPPDGDWTWTVTAPGGTSRQSTFFSNGLSLEMLRLQSEDARPGRSPVGDAARHVLDHMDGTHTVGQLAASMRERAPKTYPSSEAALAAARILIRRYGRSD